MLKHIGFPPELEALLAAEDRKSPIWIVGGAIRDYLLQHRSHDLDFTTAGDAIALARAAADCLDADVYILDRERGAGRVLLEIPDGQRRTYDFAQLRGDTIEADLRARDFTINALALRVTALEEMIDPCGGVQHLRDGILDLCEQDAIQRDPIRSLRAIRIAIEFALQFSPHLIKALRERPSLEELSRERVRDEIFNILGLSEPSPALQLLLEFGYIPDLMLTSHSPTSGLDSGLTDRESFQKAIRGIKHLSSILNLLDQDVDLEEAAQATLGLLTWTLGRYRTDLHQYLNEEVSYDRNRRDLLLFITLLHSIYMPREQHELRESSDILSLAEQRQIYKDIGDLFRLSREEIVLMDRWHGALSKLDPSTASQTNTDIFSYRYFREARDGGIGAVLSMLAYELSNQIEPPAAERWASRIKLARTLFEAWFEKYEFIVEPEHLIDGDDVMELLGSTPGPDIGHIIENVREGQVSGELSTRDQVLKFIQKQYGS
jgi:tRNA nucleotidyltransferase/poly(A) polymerase